MTHARINVLVTCLRMEASAVAKRYWLSLVFVIFRSHILCLYLLLFVTMVFAIRYQTLLFVSFRFRPPAFVIILHHVHYLLLSRSRWYLCLIVSIC